MYSCKPFSGPPTRECKTLILAGVRTLGTGGGGTVFFVYFDGSNERWGLTRSIRVGVEVGSWSTLPLHRGVEVRRWSTPSELSRRAVRRLVRRVYI